MKGGTLARARTHRSIGPLLAAVLARPPPQVRRVPVTLHVHAAHHREGREDHEDHEDHEDRPVDDAEEQLHHGHPLVHQLHPSVQTLQYIRGYNSCHVIIWTSTRYYTILTILKKSQRETLNPDEHF